MTRERGFTLVEVLVAMAVLGAVLATIYGMVSGQLRRIVRGDEQVTLALFAEGLLGRAGLDLNAGGSGRTGDGLSWTIERRPVVLPPLPPEAAPGEPEADEAAEGEAGVERRTRDALDEAPEVEAPEVGGTAEGGRTSAATRRAPPRLVEFRVTVENQRGQRYSVATMALEAVDRDDGPDLLRDEDEPAAGGLLR